MRVLLATIHPYPHPGGISTHTLRLTDELKKLKCEVEVISFRSVPKVILASLVYVPFDILRSISSTIAWLWEFYTEKLLFGLFLFFKCILRKYDIVNVQDVVTFHCAAALKRILGIPIVLTAHGPVLLLLQHQKSEEVNLENFLPVYIRLEKEAYMQADAVIAVSNFEKEKIRSYVPSSKVFAISNGVDIKDFLNVPSLSIRGAPSLLFVGRLAWIKGLDLLLKALPQVTAELPNTLLHIVGEGPWKAYLVNLANSLSLKNVQFHGYVSPKCLRSFYKSADIVAMPSRYEPFGIVALEAMASGKPVVTTGVGGLSEFVIDGENGLIAKPSPEDIAKKIIELWKDSDLRNEISRKALRTARGYRWDFIARKYLTTYRLVFKSQLACNLTEKRQLYA